MDGGVREIVLPRVVAFWEMTSIDFLAGIIVSDAAFRSTPNLVVVCRE